MGIQDAEHIFQDRDFRFGVVVDRLGVGGPIKMADGHTLPGEFWFDGYPRVMGKETRLRGPELIHLFRNQCLMVHTLDGAFVHRFGLKDGDEGLKEQLGPEACDTSPIDVDLERVEHWDVEAMDPQARTRVTRRMRPDRGMTQNQGSGNRSTQHLPSPI